ncbi:MAG: hypothetical protein M3O61_17685 [Gemmatimonadota bacterium]|nr:hypothetical protein [Gemmatimonadota bacterium]
MSDVVAGLARVRLHNADGSFRESELITTAAAQDLHSRCFSAIHFFRGNPIFPFNRVYLSNPTHGLPATWFSGDYTDVTIEHV